MTQVFHWIKEWQQFRRQPFFNNKTVGLVATMGNLHRGHNSLLTRSVAENDVTVLTIFVNGTQFNDPNDLKNYPRTFEQDLELAKAAGVDFILAPQYEEMYPDNYQYKVTESDFSLELCGKSRPGHFDGVLTVVLKILLLVKANRTYFGEKDFQQLQLVTGMAQAFFVDTEIVPCPIVREQNGLALSSRNGLLNAEQLELAPNFQRLLNSKNSPAAIKQQLTELGFVVDYIEEFQGRRFGAVKLGTVRLIDNVEFE